MDALRCRLAQVLTLPTPFYFFSLHDEVTALVALRSSTLVFSRQYLCERRLLGGVGPQEALGKSWYRQELSAEVQRIASGTADRGASRIAS